MSRQVETIETPDEPLVQISDASPIQTSDESRLSSFDASHLKAPDERNQRKGNVRYKLSDAFRPPPSIREIKIRKGNGWRPEGLFVGISVAPKHDDPDVLVIGITLHDGTYSMDYNVYYKGVKREDRSGSATPTYSTSTGDFDYTEFDDLELDDFICAQIYRFRKAHYYKILGCGMTKATEERCNERLARKLWATQDIVALTFAPFGKDEPEEEESGDDSRATMGTESQVDEESDSVVRKVLEKFGQHNQLRLSVRKHNRVGVDANSMANLVGLANFRSSVHLNTWESTLKYTSSLQKRKTKIAFFNSTPQGGGVALMRHALIRFCRSMEVDCKWYVPRPKPEVFTITKANHNILQGVDQSWEKELTEASILTLDSWCSDNAERYWLCKNGPLRPRSEGGADVIIVDDPQMPLLVRLAKEQDPDRPVIYRSHIQVRADLVTNPAEVASTVWKWVWDRVQKCDVFVSHPVPDFVPQNVPSEKVGYMPATTDWLDGLNKNMEPWDVEFYLHEFQADILSRQLPFSFDYDNRKYIVQIARFDPAKGILHVLAAYAELRRKYMADWDRQDTPQLVVAGHGAIDDPDAVPIYTQVMDTIRTHYKELEEDIIVMRVGPVDQILNALMTKAHVALQLSSREGFEVKVSEALFHGKPIIATKRGGIPLQVEHGKNGFLVESNDSTPVVVGKYLYDLFSDTALYERMSVYAKTHVSDEVSTVGNALCWFYLADMLSQGRKVEPAQRWINDMAREEAGIPYDRKEARLHRDLHLTHTYT
ncbi:trehalose phosphorylase [Paraphoma chrysanthemicola]|uniref:Trehalose phosphorylase n=1 Tax=Paraphoma chrysanthemicola TaxID=798071 RepID=A0A8K0VYY3_9PLEO|nr:trehalose phosphorylase [Paraphoma chrysanthemicola]